MPPAAHSKASTGRTETKNSLIINTTALICRFWGFVVLLVAKGTQNHGLKKPDLRADNGFQAHHPILRSPKNPGIEPESFVSIFFRQSGCSFWLRAAAHGWDHTGVFPIRGTQGEVRKCAAITKKSRSLFPPRRGRHARRPPRRPPAPCAGNGGSPPSKPPCPCRGESTPTPRRPSARRR